MQTDAEIQAKMVGLYAAGKTLAECAAPFGLSTKAARNALKRAGVARRPAGKPQNYPRLGLTGEQFGFLTVVGLTQNRTGKLLKWDCRCRCGTVVSIPTGHLRSGHTRSCGPCLRGEFHGMSDSDEFRIWARIKQRCTNPNTDDWPLYGGRGVFMCLGFQESFALFHEILGPRPGKKHSVDRIDNDGGYACGRCDECRENNRVLNVRWATQPEQMANTRVTYQITFRGETKTLREWAKMTHIPIAVIRVRLSVLGWTVERALTEVYRKVGSGKRKLTPTQRTRSIWAGMIRRCHNPKERTYKWYGAKGVTVCERWRESFDDFLADVGVRPSAEHSLDRYPDPAGNYEPGNVRWATRQEQRANQRPDRAKIARTTPRRLSDAT